MPGQEKTLLICYDGSARAKNAIEVAAKLFPGARAKVLHVWEPVEHIVARYAVLAPYLGDDVDRADQGVEAESATIAQEGADLATASGLHATAHTETLKTSVWEAVIESSRALEADLVDGLASEQFFLHYQPTFSLDSGRITGVEALLRWRHPVRGLVMPDQFIDRTMLRTSTFFGDGIVGHVAFGDPVCATVAGAIKQGAESAGVVAKAGGVYVCIEGPQFSTRAESNLYRSWGADIIGMTNLQEAKLAREAEICYATMAMVTDYDCWHDGHDAVTVEQVVAVLHQNSANAARAVRAAVAVMPHERACACASALQFAILTSPEAIPAATRSKLDLLLGKYSS